MVPERAVPSASAIRLHSRLRGLKACDIARACLLALAFWGCLFASVREGLRACNATRCGRW